MSTFEPAGENIPQGEVPNRGQCSPPTNEEMSALHRTWDVLRGLAEVLTNSELMLQLDKALPEVMDQPKPSAMLAHWKFFMGSQLNHILQYAPKVEESPQHSKETATSAVNSNEDVIGVALTTTSLTPNFQILKSELDEAINAVEMRINESSLAPSELLRRESKVKQLEEKVEEDRKQLQEDQENLISDRRHLVSAEKLNQQRAADNTLAGNRLSRREQEIVQRETNAQVFETRLSAAAADLGESLVAKILTVAKKVEAAKMSEMKESSAQGENR